MVSLGVEVVDVGILLVGLAIGEGEVEVLNVVDMDLGPVAPNASVSVVRIPWIGLFLRFVSLVVPFLVPSLRAFLSYVHQVDVLELGHAVNDGGQ